MRNTSTLGRRASTGLLAVLITAGAAVVFPTTASAQRVICCYYERTTTVRYVHGEVDSVTITYELIGCNDGDCPAS